MSLFNIQSGFAAIGLIPLLPEKVLPMLPTRPKTPTPPSTAESNQSFAIGKTPAKSTTVGKAEEVNPTPSKSSIDIF